MSLRTLFWWVVGSRGLRAVERTVLDAVRHELPEELAATFEARVESVNKVQRLTAGKEVNLYHLERGKPRIHSRLLDTDEVKLLARVLITDGRHHQAEAKVWVVNGQLFSLTFSRPPRELERMIRVLSVNLFPPLNLPLPDDHERLSRIPGTAGVGGWTVLDRGQIREIVLDNGNYYAVAEHPTFGVLAVRESDASSRLYLLRFEDSRVVPCGTTLQDALQYAADATGETQ